MFHGEYGDCVNQFVYNLLLQFIVVVNIIVYCLIMTNLKINILSGNVKLMLIY